MRLLMKEIILILTIILYDNGTTTNGDDLFVRSYKNGMARYLCDKEMSYGMKQSMLDICYEKANYYGYSITGFNKGLQECRKSFRNDRWNCTTEGSNTNYKLFGQVMARASKESAAMFAMVSAGMTEEITAELQSGNRRHTEGVPNGCNQPHHLTTPRDFVASYDCDADLAVGSKFAEKIIKYWQPTLKSNSEALMNNHNAGVGREAVKLNMQKICRCIGMSGACHAKCCYRTLKPLKVSADWLKRQYDNAVKVTREDRWRRDGSQMLVNAKDHGTPKKTDLIYLLESPNYCSKDKNQGSLGTKGRICNSTSSQANGCEHLCCQRGYVTHEMDTNEHCNCKFKWCCEVKCDKCKVRKTEYRCK